MARIAPANAAESERKNDQTLGGCCDVSTYARTRASLAFRSRSFSTASEFLAAKWRNSAQGGANPKWLRRKVSLNFGLRIGTCGFGMAWWFAES
ncbi:MAG: hypothetical protein DMF38_12965 [Verrucomicrobia bacterium]|nr:MAG: hypothetical protein DMF38_12965 [Verrucomicrobiota bacterium]